MRVLVLGGTAEARALAVALDARRGHEVVSSLAGRVREPVLPPGAARVGGFGGADGLRAYLTAERIGAVVDATHPFAAAMTVNAVHATAAAGVPLTVLRRPGWTAGPGDEWHRVPSLDAAAAVLPELGERVFLSTGRGDLAAFVASDRWFLLRSVDPPRPPLPRRCRVVLDRGPFTVDGERALLDAHRIDVVVTRDSGGPAPKLVAARERGRPVVMVERPPLPPGVTAVATVDEVLAAICA